MKAPTWVRIFPELYNVEDFYMQEHPRSLSPFDPLSGYKEHWERIERQCIEGVWGHDYNKKKNLGGWRFMSPQLMLGHNVMLLPDDAEGQGTSLVKPKLRDVDWVMDYGAFTALGFSGMELDDQHTCSTIVKKIELGLELTPLEELDRSERGDNLYKKRGGFKKYVDPIHYLYSTHKEPMGLPLYENPCLNFTTLSSRGVGKTQYIVRAPLAHTMLFFNAKRWEDKYTNQELSENVIVGSSDGDKSGKLLAYFEALLKNHIFTLGSYVDNGNFIPGYFHLNFKGNFDTDGRNPFRHSYEYKKDGVFRTGGSNTTLFHKVFPVHRPASAVGGRASDIYHDEFGLCSNAIEVQGACEAVLTRHNRKSGRTVNTGTGGVIKTIGQPQAIFYDPVGTQGVCYEDIFEYCGKPISNFLPAYVKGNEFKDELGNTLYELGWKQEMLQRAMKEKGDPAVYRSYVMSYPVVPSEMFQQAVGNKWPSLQFAERKSQLLMNDNWKSIVRIGEMVRVQKDEVVWVPKTFEETNPIYLFNINQGQATSKNSAWLVYEHMLESTKIYGQSNIVVPNKVVYDPTKKDTDGPSLGGIVVIKEQGFYAGRQNTVVAELYARRTRTNMHDQAINACIRYGGLKGLSKIQFETNKSDFDVYAKAKGYECLLQPEPTLITGGNPLDLDKNTIYGVAMTDNLKFIADEWLIQWYLSRQGKEDENGNYPTVIDYLCSVRLCDEHINYQEDKNYDGISAMRLYGLWKLNEEAMILAKRREAYRNNGTEAWKQSYMPWLKNNKDAGNRDRGDYRPNVAETVSSQEVQGRRGLPVFREDVATLGLDFWFDTKEGA